MKPHYNTYNDDKPFTMQDAKGLQNIWARITAAEFGLRHTYEGIIAPYNEEITAVGDDLVMNECIIVTEYKV